MADFSWTINEDEFERPWGILISITVVSLGVAIYTFFRENFFGTALFVIAPAVIIITSLQGQKNFKVDISEDGISINGKATHYNELEYFAFTEDTLILQEKKGSPRHIPINTEDIESIRSALQKYMLEGQHEESLGEVINRILRIR